MPLYEYRCEACHHQFEKIQKFSDEPVSVCPSCGQGPVVKLLSSPAIQFKGSGWYITDYARKGAGPSSSSSAPSAAKDGGKDSGKDTAASSGTKTESASTPAPAPASKD